jgi:GNAT superfamily N-acetyltransferase
MSSVVRPAEAGDLDLLEEIENSADTVLIDLLHPEEWRPAPDAITRASMDGFILVVAPSADAEVVGFAHVLEAEGIAHLEQLSVIPAYARRGLGRALVESAMTEAARRGYSVITLRTFADVPWNGPFYASCGFRESQPGSRFHKALERAEVGLGSDRYGRRIQMTAYLSDGDSTTVARILAFFARFE